MRVVEGSEVLIGGSRRRPSPDDAENDRGENESDRWPDRADPQRRFDERVEDHLDEVLEAAHEQPGHDSGNRGDEDHLAGSPDQTPELIAAD